MLIREEKFRDSPTQYVVEGGGGTDQTVGRTFLHFKFAAFEKLHCLWLLPSVRLADKGLHTAR